MLITFVLNVNSGAFHPSILQQVKGRCLLLDFLVLPCVECFPVQPGGHQGGCPRVGSATFHGVTQLSV